MSQLLLRLERELQLASHPDHRAEILARMAAYLGRVGRFDEARGHIDSLRKIYGDGRSGRVTVWVMLAEGLAHLFEDLSPQAMDRITRALMLGVAMKYSPIVGLAAAWKAHMEFQSGDYDSMVRSLNLSAQHAEDADLDATTRRSIVLCNAYMICGERSVAQSWFLLAKDCAVKNGDQASLEALIYNRAAFLTTWLRAENCINPVSKDELKHVRMEIASARNFQDLTGVAALTVHIHLWDARLHLLEGDYIGAIERLSAIRKELPPSEYSFSQAYIDLEICFALAKSGQLPEALAIHSILPQLDMSRLDIDEQLVAVWIRRQLTDFGEQFGRTESFELELDQLRAAYIASKSGLLAHLRNVSLQVQ
jgi:tetratricopeptide (TPR) repeat protein